jgi:hypothetical protein
MTYVLVVELYVQRYFSDQMVSQQHLFFTQQNVMKRSSIVSCEESYEDDILAQGLDLMTLVTDVTDTST